MKNVSVIGFRAEVKNEHITSEMLDVLHRTENFKIHSEKKGIVIFKKDVKLEYGERICKYCFAPTTSEYCSEFCYNNR